ncbi:MAG: arginine--tRNA ligase [Alphaproteobacteria bacterium]|nr:arginine--tRNA ligase [Alphaproteobacteria bacterium]
MNLHKFITDAIHEKLAAIPDLGGADISTITVEVPKVRNFGDFATNAAMVLARPLKQNPHSVAEQILPEISTLPFVADVSVAGPGFINIKLKDEFIIESAAKKSEIRAPQSVMTIDLDYGAYNVAKTMHIGHLRGSIIGDTLYRIARFLGHRPISYNHIGDWGKPMALVIAWIIKKFPNDWNKPDFKIDESEFNSYYPTAAKYAKEDAEFLKQVLQIKKEFQDGHPEYFALYEKMMKISLEEMAAVVKRLNIVPFDNTLGERNAAQYLNEVEKILREKNLLTIDNGATIINLKTESDTAPMPPFMFYDSRGADTYDSTDLAAMYYRKITDNPDKIIYMSDFRQNLHFEQLFRASEMAGIFPRNALESMGFGGINGKDGKPLKTRDGGAATLNGAIDMIEEAARARVLESGKNLCTDTVKMIALAALKFNDLMHDVKSNYIFDPDAVTQFEGRTGPYILYTAVRLNSILSKVETSVTDFRLSTLEIEERNLLLTVLDFERTVSTAFDKRATDILANYTYELCQMINTFYHNCPILRNDVSADIRAHRIGIVRSALDVLSRAIDLMGLEIPKEM